MTFGVATRVHHAQARQISQPHRLPRNAKHAANHGLTGNNGGNRCDDDQRNNAPVGRHVKEWSKRLQRFLIQRALANKFQYIRALAEVIQQQRWQHNGVPSELNWKLSKVANIGVQRLRARDHKHHGTQHGECLKWIALNEIPNIDGIQRLDDLRIHLNLVKPHHPQEQEPRDHDWAEEFANAASAKLLHREEAG